MRVSAFAALLVMGAAAGAQVAIAGCARPPLSGPAGAASALDASRHASTPPRPAASRGKPFVVAGDHAVLGAAWLPNGHLLGASSRELFDVSPEPIPSGASSEVRVVPVETRIKELLGARGAARFVLAHDTSLSIWDAATLRPVARIQAASAAILSANGERLAAKLCEPVCAYHVFDTYAGTLLSRIEPASADFAGRFTFAGDGRFALLDTRLAYVVVDTTSGKVVARRRPRSVTTDAPQRRLAIFRPGRVVLGTRDGAEILGLPSGKTLARLADPFGDDPDVVYAANDDASLVTFHAEHRERAAIWSTEPRAGVPTTRTVSVPRTGWSCNRELTPIEGTDRVHVAGWVVDLKTGALQPGSTECDEQRLPSTRFERVTSSTPTTLEGSGLTCHVIERATRRIAVSHPASCGGNGDDDDGGANAVGGAHPGFRGDDRFFAAVHEGAAHVFDLAPGGARVVAIGGLVSRMEHGQVLEVVDGLPAIGGSRARVFLSRRPLPPAPGPGVPPVERVGPNGTVVATRTHTFAVSSRPGSRVVTAWDRATGKEVLRQTVVETPDETIAASESVAFVRAGKEGSYLRCEVGAGCAPAAFEGVTLLAFDHPWVLLQGRRKYEVSLVDVTTREIRPVTSLAWASGCTAISPDGPSVLCGHGTDAAFVGLDGARAPVPLPSSAPDATSLRGRSGPHVYFDAPVTAGLTPGYRSDVRTGEVVDLFLGPRLAIARFPDGTVERLGDVAAADDWLRCLDGDRLLPWSACSPAHVVEGKLDASLPLRRAAD